MTSSGKELAKLPLGTKVLYEHNPKSDKTKRPKWCKGPIRNRCNPRKYKILTDNDQVITQSRHHIKGYCTWSGRMVKPPRQINARVKLVCGHLCPQN